MKIRTSMIALSLAALLSGCQSLNTEGLMQSGAQAFQAATLNDADVKALSEKSCVEMDQKPRSLQRIVNMVNVWQNCCRLGR